MPTRRIRVPLIMGFIPYRIEADWDPVATHLAGFPLNIVYSDVRPDDTGVRERFIACYWFDEGSYREDETIREMMYVPRRPAGDTAGTEMAPVSPEENPYHVLVRYQKASGVWETFKFRGERQIAYASGADYDRALIHTTLIHLEPDEPADILDVTRHDTLVSVTIGSRIDQLFDHFPQLHAHRWESGEVLYEACNHDTQEVFTFIEEPHSRGRITKVWVRQAEDPSVCKDDHGMLPQVSTPAVTPRGVKVGDPAGRVIEQYGDPVRVERNVPGTALLVYEPPSPPRSLAANLLLSFLVSEHRVVGFMLKGNVRGIKPPKGPEEP
ncbi:MAG: hypothetical protein H6Q33_4651 [Deltaproteobacteria bacterium]|nr:hypothetical protein [Deltaproteobacteria bacterium]